jgi:diguanylate cyclase (GGDEF)-like protein
VARLGGDEFVIILPQLDDQKDIDRVAEAIVDKIAQPFDLDGHSVTISASVGIAIYPDHGASAEELIGNADKAMYRAKQQGRGRHCHYDAEVDAS